MNDRLKESSFAVRLSQICSIYRVACLLSISEAIINEIQAMSKPNSFSTDTLRATGTSIAVPVPPHSLKERVFDFIRHHRLKPQRIKALEHVMAALEEKDRTLRAKLSQASVSAEKKRLRKDLAIIERQQDKGQAILDQWG